MCSFSVCRRLTLARKKLTGRGKRDLKGHKQKNSPHCVYVFQPTKPWPTDLHVCVQDWAASYVHAMFHFKTNYFVNYSVGASRREITVVTLNMLRSEVWCIFYSDCCIFRNAASEVVTSWAAQAWIPLLFPSKRNRPTENRNSYSSGLMPNCCIFFRRKISCFILDMFSQ